MPGFNPVSKGSDIREILTRLGDPTGETLATIVAKLGDPSTALGALLEHGTYGLPLLARTAMLNIMEHEIEFPSDEVTDVISGDGITGPQDVHVTIPENASIRRVVILALVTALNDTAAGPMKIDLDFQGKAAPDAWPGTTLWSQDDVIGFGTVEGATTSIVMVARPAVANGLVTEVGTYNFRVVVTNPTAGNIRYTTQYLVVVTYRMS